MSHAPPTSNSSDAFAPEVRRMLPWIIALRLIVNTAIRMTYSFLPAFSRGAQISQASMGAVLAARDLSGLTAPMAGRLADRKGTGRALAAAGLGSVVGLGISATTPTGLIVGFVLVGLGSVALNVSSGAWIGHAVAYPRRARATGLAELSWGVAALIGVPLMGVLIDQLGWRAPSIFLGLVALPVSLYVSRNNSELSVADPFERETATTNRTVVGGLTSFTLLIASAQFMFLGHGLWLEDTYGLSTTGVGLVVFAAAVMEVAATLATTRLTDGLGKKRAVMLGTALMVLAMTALAIAPAAPLPVAVVLLALMFLGFEFAVVSGISLVSELDPHARATTVARGVAISTVGRAAVSLVAVGIYQQLGFGPLMAIAAAFGVATLGALLTFDEPQSLRE